MKNVNRTMGLWNRDSLEELIRSSEYLESFIAKLANGRFAQERLEQAKLVLAGARGA